MPPAAPAVTYQPVVTPFPPQGYAPAPSYPPAATPTYQQPGAPAYPPAAMPPAQPPTYPFENEAAELEPLRRAAKRKSGPYGVGGFLLLPMLGLILIMCWSAWTVYDQFMPFRQSDAYAALTTPGSPIYHWLWQPFTLFQVFAAAVMFLAPIALLSMISGKRTGARGYTVAFYVFCCLAAGVSSGASILLMVDALRSSGLTDAAADVTTYAMRNLYQTGALALIWIPYMLGSRRVRNTFAAPVADADIDPAYFMAASELRRKKGRRSSGALVVAAIVLVAGAATAGYSTFLPSSAGGAVSEAEQLAQQADAAFAAGDLSKSAVLYMQATESDPNYERAYLGEWSAFVKKKDLPDALHVAAKTTERFPGSRQAWFALGYAQEAGGDLSSAADSYTKAAALPQSTDPGVGQLADTVIQERLALVSYVLAITEPRTAIASAVNQVNTALQDAAAQPAALAAAAGQVTSVLSAKMAELQKIVAPEYFASFHAGMLKAYGDLATACEGLATAAALNDTAALDTAKRSLNGAIDSFNQNDAVGTSLIDDYYGQEPPIGFARPAAIQ